MALASKDIVLHKIKFALLNLINSVIAMILIALIALPIMWLVVFLFSFEIKETNEVFLNKYDIILVIWFIGLLFEFGDRLYIGIKKNKLVSIIRDKADRH